MMMMCMCNSLDDDQRIEIYYLPLRDEENLKIKTEGYYNTSISYYIISYHIILTPLHTPPPPLVRTRFDFENIDVEIKEASINAMGKIMSHFGDYMEKNGKCSV